MKQYMESLLDGYAFWESTKTSPGFSACEPAASRFSFQSIITRCNFHTTLNIFQSFQNFKRFGPASWIWASLVRPRNQAIPTGWNDL
jgi:hypothetical protein